MSCSSLMPASPGVTRHARFEWLGVGSLIVFRRSASEFRTSAGSASCMGCRLGASLSVMSRDGEKFPEGATSLAGPQVDASGILGDLGFPEGPLGAAPPEEAHGEINYRSPQGRQRAASSQEKQDCGDTLKRIRQTADGSASKLRSYGF